MTYFYKHRPDYFLCLFLVLISSVAHAHKASESYMTLEQKDAKTIFTIDIAVRDLQNAINLDIDRNRKITWSEVRDHTAAIAFIDLNTAFSTNTQACPKHFSQMAIRSMSDGHYLRLEYDLNCDLGGDPLSLAYTLFNLVDTQHRGLLKTTTQDTQRLLVFDNQGADRLINAKVDSGNDTLVDYLGLGVLHIWEGWDHLLFLLTLLIPCVLVRKHRHWYPTESLATTLKDVAFIVTAFTLAHSLTLSLVSFGLVPGTLPMIEVLIALSVTLAALHNIFPVLPFKRWVIGLVFGLIHGFGFAGALNELDVTDTSLMLALFGFNLGVELGQLAVVVVFVPLIFAMRKQRFYQRVVLHFGSIGISCVGLLWTIQRISG